MSELNLSNSVLMRKFDNAGHRQTRLLRYPLISLCVILTGPLKGQPGEPAAGDTNALQEIVVTATRREEALSNVPISVSAFTQESLDRRGIKDITDVVRFTPGVSIDQTGTNAISIRGISSSGGAGTTGIYVDDTPIQIRALGFNPDDTLPAAFDLERIEVLRGPQGTLFGAGSEGGTVRYILAAPALNNVSRYVRAEASTTMGGEPSYEFGAAQGGPLRDGILGYRASIWYRRDGGWIDRVDPFTRAVVDTDANRGNTLSLRVALAWQPTDGVMLTPSIMYQNRRRHDVSEYWVPLSNPNRHEFTNGGFTQIPNPDEFYLPAIKFSIDIGKAQLVANTSYFHRREQSGYDGTLYSLSYFQSLGWPASVPALTFVDPTQYPLLDSAGPHLPSDLHRYRAPATIQNEQTYFTQEIRFASADLSSPWNWTIGLFWSINRESSTEEIHDPQLDTILSALFATSSVDAFGVPPLDNGDSYLNRNVSHDRQLAVFGEASFQFLPKWTATLGARISKTSFSLDHHSDGPLNFGASDSSASQRETPFTPRLGLSYRPADGRLYYATYAKGFRAGAGNSPLPPYCNADLAALGYPAGAPLQYKSDSTQSGELGIKQSIGTAVKLAASAFYTRWSNIQQSLYVQGSCGLQFTDNLGTAVSKGFDLTIEAALGNSLSLEAAVGYTDARYSSDTLKGLAGNPTILVRAGNAISGEAAIQGSPGSIPPWSASLGLQYDRTLGSIRSFTRIDYEYTSRNPWLTASQDPSTSSYDPYAYTLPATSFVSLRGGIKFGDWTVAAFVDNLFDSHTTTNFIHSSVDVTNPSTPPGPLYNNFTFRPRTVGLTVTLRQ